MVSAKPLKEAAFALVRTGPNTSIYRAKQALATYGLDMYLWPSAAGSMALGAHRRARPSSAVAKVRTRLGVRGKSLLIAYLLIAYREPQRLKAAIHSSSLTARLKPCPFQDEAAFRVFQKIRRSLGGLRGHQEPRFRGGLHLPEFYAACLAVRTRDQGSAEGDGG